MSRRANVGSLRGLNFVDVNGKSSLGVVTDSIRSFYFDALKGSLKKSVSKFFHNVHEFVLHTSSDLSRLTSASGRETLHGMRILVSFLGRIIFRPVVEVKRFSPVMFIHT